MRVTSSFHVVIVAVAAMLTAFCALYAAEKPLIVKDGKPNAEIIISGQPTRTQKLAAEELQAGIEKMTGARLDVTNAPGEKYPVKIYVGRSVFICGPHSPLRRLSPGSGSLSMWRDFVISHANPTGRPGRVTQRRPGRASG